MKEIQHRIKCRAIARAMAAAPNQEIKEILYSYFKKL
jgi:hypothetical protein